MTQADIDRLVARDFEPADREEAHGLLERYGVEGWEREVVRVRIAILRMADGDLARMRTALETAKVDYRDALVAAEYTAEFVRGNQAPDASAEEQAALRARDRQDYAEWLRRA